MVNWFKCNGLNLILQKIIEKALVVNQSSYPAIDYLFVDEFQDTDPKQYEFIKRIPTYGRFYCGDERQFIYGFRGCTDKFIREIANDPTFKVYNLNMNYRNPPNILKYADGFLNSMKKISLNSVAAKWDDGVLEECSLYDALEDLKEDKHWGDWVIICRTNAEIDTVQELLNEEENQIPNVVIRRGDLNLEMLGDLLKSDRVKIATAHACVSGDTLINTNYGVKQIDEVVKEKRPDIRVFNGIYYDSVKNFIDNGVKLTYKITSKTGNTLRVTEDHDCIVLDGDALVKKKTKDLSGNEEILIKRDLPEDSERLIPLEQVKKEELYHNAYLYTAPQYLNEDLAELIGMITADGTRNKSSIHYTKRHEDCVKRFCQLIFNLFGKEVSYKKSNYENAYVAECNSTYILTFMYKNFNGVNNNDKYISQKILEANKNIQCAFLRGLFEDGTVKIKNDRFDHICISFKNPKMISQLQTLLFNNGIEASFVTHQYKTQVNPINYCYIYAASTKVFAEKIGFISSFKNEKLQKIDVKYDRKNKSKVLLKILLKYKDQIKWKTSKSMWKNFEKNGALTAGIFGEIYEHFSEELKQNEDIQFIKSIFDNYLIEPISSIEPYKEEPTYCLEMEHESQFLQNGFLMGNCKGLEFPHVIAVGMLFFNEEERRISYVAATRAEQSLYWCPAIKGKKKKKKAISNTSVFDKTSMQSITF